MKDHSASLPETGYLRLPQVLQLIPISKSTLWSMVKSGQFPKPLKLSARVTAWRIEDIRHWMNKRNTDIYRDDPG